MLAPSPAGRGGIRGATCFRRFLNMETTSTTR